MYRFHNFLYIPKKKFKKICNLLLIITNKCLYLHIINSIAMKKEQLIELLKTEEGKLWEALKNSETVFGVEHEATKMARARWVTAVDMSSIVQLNLNQDDNI